MTAAGQAVVVGATGTIGQAVIRRLTGRGLPVLAVARGRDDLDKLAAADELVTPCPADIGSNDAIGAIGSALAGLDGPVRMAVFAAGLPVRGSADTIDPDALAVGSNIKVGGLLRLLHAVRDRLVPGSRFVTFAGSLGLEPRAHEAGPGAVNAAVFNLMRQISLLYGPRGVTTHTLSPGPADTPRLRRIVAAVAAERGAAEAGRLAGVRGAEFAGPAAHRGRAGLGGGDAARPGGQHPARQRAPPGRGRPPRDRLIAGGRTDTQPVRRYIQAGGR